MKKILVICMVLFLMGCARMSYYEQAYRDGAISYTTWQYLERQEQDFRDGKGRYAIGGPKTDALIQQMLMEPIPVRIMR